MKFGEGRLTRGRWSFYVDTAGQSIGRNAGETAVYYMPLPCLVFRHEREHTDPDTLVERRHVAAIRHWQRVRNAAWGAANGYFFSQRPTPADRNKGTWRQCVDLYESRAGDARARGEWAPTIEELSRFEDQNIVPAIYE